MVCSWLCTCHCSIALSLPMQTFSSPLSSQWLLSTCCHQWLFRLFSTSQPKILSTWRSKPLVTPVCTLLRTWALAICWSTSIYVKLLFGSWLDAAKIRASVQPSGTTSTTRHCSGAPSFAYFLKVIWKHAAQFSSAWPTWSGKRTTILWSTITSSQSYFARLFSVFLSSLNSSTIATLILWRMKSLLKNTVTSMMDLCLTRAKKSAKLPYSILSGSLCAVFSSLWLASTLRKIYGSKWRSTSQQALLISVIS